MKKSIQKLGRSTPLTLLPALALALTCAVPVFAQVGSLPHGGLTRDEFVMAKALAGGDKDNNGELGDAADVVAAVVGEQHRAAAQPAPGTASTPPDRWGSPAVA